MNNAGIQHVAPVDEFPVEKWNAIIAIYLSAAFHTTRLALPGMKTRGWGRVLNLASVHALVASPSARHQPLPALHRWPAGAGQQWRQAPGPGGGKPNPGLLAIQFRAGSLPGLYRPTVELLKGNSYRFTVEAR